MGNVGNQAINPPLCGKLPYNPETAFAPDFLVADLPMMQVKCRAPTLM